MNKLTYLKDIFIYPIKSLDAVSLNQATILDSGAIQHDRQFALIDDKGHFVNGKRHPKIHKIRSSFNSKMENITLQIQEKETKLTFNLNRERTSLETWFSDYFGFTVKLIENTVMGFPDDTQAKGPTIISTATLETLASWYPGVTVAEMRRRLRANLEIDGVPPFWEDQLFTESGRSLEFTIGEVLIEGINPCQRCIVPTRDSQTGEVTANFQQIFSTKRKESLPPWINPTRFNHYYRVSVNTNIPPSEAGKVLNTGDEIKLLRIF